RRDGDGQRGDPSRSLRAKEGGDPGGKPALGGGEGAADRRDLELSGGGRVAPRRRGLPGRRAAAQSGPRFARLLLMPVPSPARPAAPPAYLRSAAPAGYRRKQAMPAATSSALTGPSASTPQGASRLWPKASMIPVVTSAERPTASLTMNPCTPK